MTLGEKIKKIRTQKKMTQIEFADMLQITQGMLSLLEQGQHEPSFSVVYILINKLHVNPYFLFSDDQRIFDNQKMFSNRAKVDQALKNLKTAIDNLNQISL